VDLWEIKGARAHLRRGAFAGPLYARMSSSAGAAPRGCKGRARILPACHHALLPARAAQVLSSELEGVLRALALGRVPQLWLKASFPSLKPLAGYTADLVARLAMLDKWFKVRACMRRVRRGHGGQGGVALAHTQV